MSEYRVGTVIQNDGQQRLITRIVDSKSYFEDQDGSSYVIDELYLEMKNKAGDITFLPLREHREDVERDPKLIESKIKGPETLEWRKLKKVNV